MRNILVIRLIGLVRFAAQERDFTQSDNAVDTASNSHGSQRRINSPYASLENWAASARNAQPRVMRENPATFAGLPKRVDDPKKCSPNSGPLKGSKYPVAIA